MNYVANNFLISQVHYTNNYLITIMNHMRIIILAITAFTFSNSVISQTKKPVVKTTPKPAVQVVPKPLLKTGLDSLSYAIGMNIGTNMKAQGVDNINYIAFNKGMADGIKDNPKPLMSQDQCNMTIQQKLQEYAAKKNFAVKEEGRKFLEENKKQPGVVVLPSGVQYKIITQGNGVKPLLEDTVVAHYKGSTIDGNVFQESFTSGQPLVYPLSNLVAGWQQVVVLMPAGSKWQLFIPSEYAYGERGSGADIPGGATLIFEIELLDVKPLKK